MSIPLRISPDEIRTIASDLGRLSEDASHVNSSLNRSWHRLDSGWESYARGDVSGQFARVMRDVSRMEAMFEQMAAALNKAAELTEGADRMAASLFEPQAEAASSSTDAITHPPTLLDSLFGFVNDIEHKVDDLIQDFRTDGVRSIDAFVLSTINQQLPPHHNGDEEFTGYKTEGKVYLPGELVDLPNSFYLEGGADVRVTRDAKGHILVKLAGMAGGGIEGSIKSILDGEVGGRGRVEAEFNFDPGKQGDMTALLALLAMTGGTAMMATGGPLGLIGGTAIDASAGGAVLIGGKQVEFMDNLASFRGEGGLAGKLGAEVPGSSLNGSGEIMFGGGIEDGKSFVSYRLNAEGKGNLNDTTGGIAVEIEGKRNLNPPGSEFTFSFEPETGFKFDPAKELKAMGLDGVGLDAKLTGSNKIEVKFSTDLPPEKVLACYDLKTGNIDFSALKGSEIKVSATPKLDGSLNAELTTSQGLGKVGVEGSGGMYTGRKMTLYEGKI